LNRSSPRLESHAKSRIRKANAVARATFDSAPDALLAVAADGGTLVWNACFEALWQPLPELLHSDAQALHRHIAVQLLDQQGYLQKVQAHGASEVAADDPPVELHDGRFFECHMAPLGAVPGVPEADGGVIIRWRDVTLRHRAEQRQRELGALLDLALMGAELAYWDVDVATGEVRASNDRWFGILGYAPSDLADNFDAWDALVHPDDAAPRLAAWEAHLAGRAARYEAEFRMRHKAGHWVWLQARGQAVARGPDGRATRLVGTRQDITRHKLTEAFLQDLANTDSLTGIANRRRFLEQAVEEIERARRYGHQLSLLMIDLDHFKAVNDRYGHAAGDEVLRGFVQTARTVMRQSDLFARVGGEEFAALLPHTGRDGARAIAERLRAEVRAAPVDLGATGLATYSISVGVATSAAPGAPPAADAEAWLLQLMQAADQLLYNAKSRGRDQVVVAPEA
jgi:diguanylate cyclase (GGDEF)-like protein/PAS domain S-box-containing protein